MNKDKDLNKEVRKQDAKARNADPITGAPGSHPIGTGVGAAVGGAAAAGAVAGMAGGPVGVAVGAAVGAVVGGLAGKGIGEMIDPTREDAYWRENHARQGWAKGRAYDEFRPAYRVGYEGYAQYGGGTFEEREAELRRRYESNKPKLSWDEARPATHAAWTKFDQEQPPNTTVDTYGNPRPM
jgi:hypothetical protein